MTFADLVQIKQIVTYLDVAAAALLVYDYILTLPEEIILVWPARWNLGKVLFFLTRYPVFIDTSLVLVHQFSILGPNACKILFTTIGWLLGVGIGIAEVILAMRTWVIWSRSRRIAIILIICLVLVWIPIFWVLNDSLSSLVFAVPSDPTFRGCVLSTQKNVLFVVFVLIMAFETFILVLTLVKGLEHFRHASSTLVAVLYRDGLLNYIYLFVLSIINVTVLLTAPHGYTTLLTAMQRVMHSILSARILLHLRQAASSRNPDLSLNNRWDQTQTNVSTDFEFAVHDPDADPSSGPRRRRGRGGSKMKNVFLDIATATFWSVAGAGGDEDGGGGGESDTWFGREAGEHSGEHVEVELWQTVH
ncbi:hypothetical protein SISNIDRAFT_461442 [Sistotremastrum niveocremeum HHB9708]|uniref:DUF6533 domain-containing protein n=1 Tax=Sistotremastrum niveocremeum HHB9708 TaxID=1314777 RepID=A0A164MMK9_9AGAM|nr:hypothetical protein SISNIDRAFT_461442 [Sistotremastrum niveocremeum HHB9708]